MWLKLIPKLHWEHGVPVRHEVKEHETVVSALNAIPESITMRDTLTIWLNMKKA